MNDIKVTYFDIDGGRGEPIRIALHAAGLSFEDIRWSFPEFGEKRGSARFNAIPIMEVNGEQFSQSNAICRYIGKQCKLYPEDPMQAMYCDEVLEALEDVTHFVVQTFGLSGDELKAARTQLMEGRLTVFFKGLEELLVRGGGQYFADNKLTIADLKMATQLRSLRSGTLDHIPPGFILDVAPKLAEYQERMENEPVIKAYYASRNSNT